MASTPKGILNNPTPAYPYVRVLEAGSLGGHVSTFNKTPVLGAKRDGGDLFELGDVNEPHSDLAARDEYLLSAIRTEGQVLEDARFGVNRIQSYADLTALAAVVGSRLNDTVLVESLGVWRCDPASSLTIDGVTVVARAGGGRWVNILRGAGVSIKLINTGTISFTRAFSAGELYLANVAVAGVQAGDLIVSTNFQIGGFGVVNGQMSILPHQATGSGGGNVEYAFQQWSGGAVTSTTYVVNFKVYRFAL